jgi:L-ascorbate metabolism protein UlaG (beta-lactamase superfamily)
VECEGRAAGVGVRIDECARITTMKITKLGHCCLIVDVRGVRFLTDPGNYSTAQNEVTNIHYVVISHEHPDHLHVESLKKVLVNNPDAQVISNAAVGRILDKEGIPYTKVSDGESFNASGVPISGHGTKHEVIYKDHEQVENTGYFFDEKFFIPGDSFHIPNKPVDILAVPVAGPWCTIAMALDYAIAVKPRVAFGIHDGNIVRPTGVTKRFPELFLPEHGIQVVYLELGKETEL